MNGNLGRDKIWNPQIWGEIDKAVQEEVGRIRVAQKVFPTVPAPGAANVPDDQFNAGPPMILIEGPTRPVIELRFEFQLSQAQVDNEATLQTARKLARIGSRVLAQAEDRLALQGGNVALPAGVGQTNAASAGAGLLGPAAGANVVQVRPVGNVAGVYQQNTFAGVIQGIGVLVNNGHPGPYALLLSTSTFADANAPVVNLETTADRLVPLLKGGFYQAVGLPENRGLLTSLGGEPTTIYLVQEITVGFNQQDPQGNYRFRVFERFQFVNREPAALVRLEFLPAGNAENAGDARGRR